ncbi:MAG: cysteine--tRNA ligase, partial [Nanoarchaeota archaeon]
DLNIPKAIQVLWQAVDDVKFDTKKKLELLYKFDEVLGLNIKEMKSENVQVSKEVQKLIDARERLRKNKLWIEADIIRERIKERGFSIKDTSDGPQAEKI